MTATEDQLAHLRTENERLVALLERHGIGWRLDVQSFSKQIPTATAGGLSPEDKIALFRRLLRGRDDVYAVRWQSSTSGRPGYAPACANA